jgi:hypothetical protein
MKSLVFVVLAVGLLGTNSKAQSVTDTQSVQTLRDFCMQEMTDPRRWLCLGYIKGVGELMEANRNAFYPLMKDDKSRLWLSTWSICPRLAPSGDAMIQAFMNWTGKHPEHWADNQQVGVVAALVEAWPCPEFQQANRPPSN